MATLVVSTEVGSPSKAGQYLKASSSESLEERSTSFGSDAASSDEARDECCDRQDEDEDEGIGFQREPLLEENDQDLSADEEAEFSLDARLASAKRWRGFRSQMTALACGPPGLTLPTGLSPPGLVPSARTPPGLPLRQVPCGPPGLAPETSVGKQGHRADKFEDGQQMLTVGAARLVQTAPSWLEHQIRAISLEALEVDAWKQLAEPEPDDPEWQLVALVGSCRLVGFATYAFFEEGPGSIMSVHHVAISQSFRGMGFGRRLLAELLRRARQKGAWAVKLFSKPAAVAFYERAGFSVIGPDLLMELRMSAHACEEEGGEA
eukprot:TRINITY_DN94971_c0_g1_i1.p1 TRINITY_DN94971_c0_g1~~TRINITY_DN94971_c0_g1_i1.p1  ORF type:complete len:333 (+),score=82.56 TRINITY_DN94971_c0_g1_i1:37-999(+)